MPFAEQTDLSPVEAATKTDSGFINSVVQAGAWTWSLAPPLTFCVTAREKLGWGALAAKWVHDTLGGCCGCLQVGQLGKVLGDPYRKCAARDKSIVTNAGCE